MLSWLKKILPLSDKTKHVPVAIRPDQASSIGTSLFDESETNKKQGDKYLRQGRWQEAAVYYRQALSIDADHADAHISLGFALREQKLYEDAKRHLQQALSINPGTADAYYILGAIAQEQGKLDAAIENFSKALTVKPDFEIVYRDLCYVLFQSGQNESAKKIIGKGITLNPNCADFHYYLGNLYNQEAKFDKAIACYQQAIALQPDHVDVLNNLGSICRDQGQLDQAAASYQRVLAIKPDCAEAHNNLGNVLRGQGQLNQAMETYQRALAINPYYVDAHNNLGNVFRDQGQLDQAAASYQRALAIKPDCAEAHSKLGNVFADQANLDQAMEAYQRALAINPDYAEAHNNLGNIFVTQGSLDAAIACFRRALALKPDLGEAYNNLGIILKAQGNLDEAMACFRKILAVKPDDVVAHHNLGTAFYDQGNLGEAMTCYRKALQIDPGYLVTRNQLLHVLQHLCEWPNLESKIEVERRTIKEASYTPDHLITPFGFLTLPGTTAAEQRLCAEKWTQNKFKPLSSLRQRLGFDFNREPNRKIHVGYLSADFHQHATAFLMAEVFDLHDRDRFRITAYSYGPDDGSAMRKRLENTFDSFVDIRPLSYEDTARKIHADHIDILVDLKGHTQNTRSAILALRPAPIQVNYLGYPGTMGIECVDYLIADRFVLPPEQQQHYSEKIVWLPDCYQPNDRSRPRLPAPSRAECGLPENAIVFCCFNQTYKITPDIFAVWCRLLQAVPGSVLWLLASNPHAEVNLKREAENRGIAPKRLVMAPKIDPVLHLARLQCADLFLDTLPCNAHTTCSDALWMGLPVITCVGETFPSRVAGSLLTAIEMPELITYNMNDYYALALELATDGAKRAAVRGKIIANRDSAALFDSPRFTRNIEDAYSQMWGQYADANEH